ncbi:MULTISPECIES: redox-sensitive transcriptional activator SoxR [Aeromonas]|uniref:redox-sensitive transcriptional activator SoxR n=1 Tax=Aeromonas TaxID=642 RepID=UPI00223FE81B|nr:MULTISPECIES: redox-sensitive transcriptional activator SoxR [Aeromonas]ELI6434048.1 redox-sensitive transcriptional activator SoxR [Aeromonas salmonicida subsp. salmonicida]MDF2407837.1 redox-sensitive transcriptional activator SoxR [Aeromonas sp. 2HA2]MDM5064076.1 redox-sensitive transcriptional activator SoxR [Aeromonas salmonicida]MDM5151723.1 redox-sensitive transcriptional activator SoxR [Aeromonas salmonicida]
MKTDRKWLAIGQIAKRAGVNASALRFYEQKGLISSVRSDGSQRLYPQDALRRIAFIRVAQGMGLSLGEIADALAGLPDGRTPDRSDWEQIASQWQGLLDQRIEALVQLKGKLTSCIGCGCLSLEHCALYNPDDQAAGQGAGPRYLLGDVPPSDPGSEEQ